MRNISPELLLGLFFGLVVLMQYVMRRIRANMPQQDTPGEPPQASAEQTAPEHTAARQADAGQWAWEVPPPSPGVPPAAPAMTARKYRAQRHEAPSMYSRGRFSRAALMGDPRKLQDAVVIAAIVGPCRAMEPHDIRQ